MRVSVIIDNFNYANFLEAAIESALAQTYSNCEVIVVDDGSTDGSRELLKKYETRVRVLLKENGGQASAFNLGLESSTGQLILFLDSDDLLDRDAIAQVVRAWRPGFAKLHFPLRIIGPDEKPNGLTMPTCRLSEGNVRKELLKRGRYVTAPTSGNVYSREFLRRVMPIPEDEWSQGNDSYLNTYAGFLGEVGAIHRRLGSYRVHEGSMSAVVDKQTVNLKQVDKLIGHGLRQQALVERIAATMNFTVAPGSFESHWLHLKLVIARQKLGGTGGGANGHSLLGSCLRFISSVTQSGDLKLVRKAQLIAWSLCAVALPKPLAERIVSYGFEFAPKSRMLRFLRSV
jgi:glycosyltransferase involved in cell wall biosynthesis